MLLILVKILSEDGLLTLSFTDSWILMICWIYVEDAPLKSFKNKIIKDKSV